MMQSCPECGSSEIISDLIVFSDEAAIGLQPPYVKLTEPKPEKTPFIWSPKSVATGFRAAICGACGYTRFYAKNHKEILETHKKGYASQKYAMDVVPV